MPTRNAKPTIFRWRTLTDAVDTTNGPEGGCQLLQNLVPAPFNRQIMVPRAAAIELTAFPTFTNPADIELQEVVGTRLYGFVASGRFAGKSEPFIYDYVAQAFVTITGVTAANCPASTNGDWTPPTAAQVGSRMVMTHPGYTGAGGFFFGWFDMTGFTSSTITGNTNSNNQVTSLSSNVLQAGWSVGMSISDSAGDIPAGTIITAIASNGISLTMSNVASGSHAGTTFTVAGGSTAAPFWTGGNMNQNPLPAVPVAVASFNGRAYYAVSDTLQFSDAGNAVQDSNNPNVQVINYQNGLNITAIQGTPFQNVLGGITQSLLVFQGAGAIQQVTGDPTTSNLVTQALALGIGTLAPNSLAFVPNVGTAFISPDGLRIVNLVGTVSPAVGTNGDGVALPFINAQFPSRMAGSWNDDTYRVCVKTAVTSAAIWGQFIWGQALWGAGEIVTQEYWYHTKLGIWTGPHTFPTTLISANQTSGGFIISSLSIGASLWASDAVPNDLDGYVENGQTLQCNALTGLMPDNQMMAQNSLSGPCTAIGLASSQGMTANVTFIRENGQALDTVSVPVSGQTAAIWGQFIWGSANWGAQASKYAQYAVYWNRPLIFKQGMLGVSFLAGPGNVLGNVYLRIEPLGYLILGASDAA
jgi:hypothetical protein